MDHMTGRGRGHGGYYDITKATGLVRLNPRQMHQARQDDEC
jgi:hypothetical protein